MPAGAFGAAATGLGIDPDTLMRDVRLEPVVADGKQTGVRVVSSNAALLEKLGLQPGDEVTSVNGIALDNPLRGARSCKRSDRAERQHHGQARRQAADAGGRRCADALREA